MIGGNGGKRQAVTMKMRWDLSFQGFPVHMQRKGAKRLIHVVLVAYFVVRFLLYEKVTVF